MLCPWSVMTEIRVNAYTQRGVERTQNEDACAVGNDFLFGKNSGPISVSLKKNDMPALVTLADGMGGHRNGEIASRTAVEYLAQIFYGSRNSFKVDEAIKETHKTLQNLGGGVHADAMGTTIAGVLLKQDQATFFNVGDSRIYQIRQGNISRMSVDHTDTRWGRLFITQCLGGGLKEPLNPHLTSSDFLPGEICVLISDGISDVVSDQKIKEIASSELENPSLELCKEAVKRGGGDDTTVVICKNSRTFCY